MVGSFDAAMRRAPSDASRRHGPAVHRSSRGAQSPYAPGARSTTKRQTEGPARSTALDSTFSALADPTRRAMLDQLARGELSITQLGRPFRMSLPAVSKHVRVLERAGLIAREKEGRSYRCRVDATPLITATRWLAQYRPLWEHQLQALATYLETPKGKKPR